jgi:hypothetical protein
MEKVAQIDGFGLIVLNPLRQTHPMQAIKHLSVS